MKNETKNTLKAVLFGILVYIIEIVFIFGLIGLITKIVNKIRNRKAAKNVKHDVQLPENVELDTKPHVETPKTTWENLKPLIEDSDVRRDESMYGNLEETTIREACTRIVNHYGSTRAIVGLNYKGKSLDVWIVPSECTLYLDGDEDKKFVVDDEFMNTPVKCSHNFMHEVFIDDVEPSTEPSVWTAMKPYVLESRDDIKVSIFKVWEDATMKDVIDYILQYYITTNALVSIVYKGKALDVWITPGTSTMYLDCDRNVTFKVDDDFLNMKVKTTKENIHLAMIED